MGLMTVLAIDAIPARRGLWRILNLSDGTQVKAQLSGDEQAHFYLGIDGKCYRSDTAGVFREISLSETQRVRRRKAVRHRACYASTDDGMGRYGQSGMGAVNSIGNYTFPVIMVQFSDLKFLAGTTVAKMKRYYNDEGYAEESGCVGSVKDYFSDQSYGSFKPSFDVVGIVTLTNSYKYYGGNDYEGMDKNVDQLARDAVKAAKTQLGIDFSKYESGGAVPLVCILYAGRGEATEYDGEDYVWPCEFDIDEDIQGTHFNAYFVGNEVYTDGTLMGMGTFCHEFGHALGLPDFYCTDGSYLEDDPFSNWSVMDCGAYLRDARAPVGYTAYEKSYLGWLDIPEMSTQVKDVTLTLDSPLESSGVSAVRVKVGTAENFILENRQPGIWYPEEYKDGISSLTMGSGLMVSRITYDKDEWNYNVLNNVQNRKRACMITANGASMYYNSDKAHLYGNGVDSIKFLKTYSGSKKELKVSEIVKNDDGTLLLKIDTTTTIPTLGLHETFDKCDGSGGNDGKWSGSIANAVFMSDCEGWENVDGVDAKYGANKCAKFGSTKKIGDVYTPLFAVDSVTTLTFKAAPWKTEDTGIMVKLYDEDKNPLEDVLSSTTFDLESEKWNSCSLSFTYKGNVYLAFTTTQNTRFFLDEVYAECKKTTGINSVEAEKDNREDGRIYSISGRYMGTSWESLPSGVYIRNGNKIVK